jgi:pyruvate kinase
MCSDTRDDLPPIRTKIVATIGPASRTPEVLRRLIEAGVNVFRLNFSHGTHEEHSAVLADILALSRETSRHVAVLQDLCGPKMRLGPIPGDLVECPLGAEFALVTEQTSYAANELTCSYRELPNDLKTGETILFADGTVGMSVMDTMPGRAHLRVTLPGRLRSRQGLNLPGSNLAVKSLTDKDLHDLDWTAKHPDDVQFVGLSFVRTAEDVEWLRRELQTRKCPAKIVVKIEKPQAVQNLEAIVAATDGVMVARGDLGVEMDVQRVPAIQKRVIALCNGTHRPVITATQMLNSMEHSSRPTRAEASDVFNAVLDGTDAVMLSGEVAVGEYPVEAVATMRQICAEAESHMKATDRAHAGVAPLTGFVEPIAEAMVDAACLVTQRLDAPLIVVATDSGRTALALSNRRPSATILAVARTEQVARLLALCWGVTAVVQPETASAEQELAFATEWAKSHGLVRSGQHAVLLRGQVPGQDRSRAVLARVVN